MKSLIIDVGIVGSYRLYTDEDGREYPVLLDYGKGLRVENTNLKANENSSAQQSTNPQKQIDKEVSDIIKAAKLNLGNSSQSNNPKPPQGPK